MFDAGVEDEVRARARRPLSSRPRGQVLGLARVAELPRDEALERDRRAHAALRRLPAQVDAADLRTDAPRCDTAAGPRSRRAPRRRAAGVRGSRRKEASHAESIEGHRDRSTQRSRATRATSRSSRRLHGRVRAYTADADLAPLFAGLPDDRCQCPHLGYVIKGKVTFKFADREETYETGDAYYAPPGHTPVLYAGTEIVEFSPTEDLGKTMEVVMRNVAGDAGSDRLSDAKAGLSRWQALGNVYVVAEEPGLTADRAKELAAGTDGVVEVRATGDDWLDVVIWNPDGSQAEMSGNATRIAARWLAGRTGPRQSRCASAPARCARACSPATTSSRTWARSEWRAGGGRRHPLHPRRRRQPARGRRGQPRRPARDRPTPRDPPALPGSHQRPGRPSSTPRGPVTARVWERGVGETTASGTSAVAVAAATHAEGEVVVSFPGGNLTVRLHDGRATLVGPRGPPRLEAQRRRLPSFCPPVERDRGGVPGGRRKRHAVSKPAFRDGGDPVRACRAPARVQRPRDDLSRPVPAHVEVARARRRADDGRRIVRRSPDPREAQRSVRPPLLGEGAVEADVAVGPSSVK